MTDNKNTSSKYHNIFDKHNQYIKEEFAKLRNTAINARNSAHKQHSCLHTLDEDDKAPCTFVEDMMYSIVNQNCTKFGIPDKTCKKIKKALFVDNDQHTK